MSASASEVKLRLECANPAAELLVVNSDFKLVAHGPPPLEASVEPGIYALKAKVGGEVTERLETLERRAEPYSFNLTAPQFESPMPLVGTSTNREYQQGSLYQFTAAAGSFIDLNGDSAIVLYIRDTSHTNFKLKPAQQSAYAANFAGFELLSASGGQLVDFNAQAVKHIGDGYVGAQVRLAAGSYVLAWDHGEQQTCLVLNTAPGWCLQVYLRLQPVRPGAIDMRPDFSDAAFAFDRIGAAYSADRNDFRAMEAVRLALLDRRNVVSTAMMHDTLYGKFQNPMLGVYGGHLLLMSKSPDYSLLGEVIENTAGLLGQHYPDVAALAWAFEVARKKRPGSFDTRAWPEILADIKGPPLLTTSWDLLLSCAEAANVDIEQLRLFRVAGHLAVSGAVLTWEQRKAKQRSGEEQPDATAVPVPAAMPEAPGAPPIAMPAPAGAPAATMAPGGGLLSSIGSRLWHGFLNAIAGKLPDGTSAPAPKIEISVAAIDTPEAAAQALRRLATKAPWHDLVRLIAHEPAKIENLTSFSALQRDLVLTLARASIEPAVRDGIDTAFINSVMRAHRVPLVTVASALRGLDIVAVSTEVIRRVKAAASSAAAKKKALAKGAKNVLAGE